MDSNNSINISIKTTNSPSGNIEWKDVTKDKSGNKQIKGEFTTSDGRKFVVNVKFNKNLTTAKVKDFLNSFGEKHLRSLVGYEMKASLKDRSITVSKKGFLGIKKEVDTTKKKPEGLSKTVKFIEQKFKEIFSKKPNSELSSPRGREPATSRIQNKDSVSDREDDLFEDESIHESDNSFDEDQLSENQDKDFVNDQDYNFFEDESKASPSPSPSLARPQRPNRSVPDIPIRRQSSEGSNGGDIETSQDKYELARRLITLGDFNNAESTLQQAKKSLGDLKDEKAEGLRKSIELSENEIKEKLTKKTQEKPVSQNRNSPPLTSSSKEPPPSLMSGSEGAKVNFSLAKEALKSNDIEQSNYLLNKALSNLNKANTNQEIDLKSDIERLLTHNSLFSKARSDHLNRDFLKLGPRPSNLSEKTKENFVLLEFHFKAWNEAKLGTAELQEKAKSTALSSNEQARLNNFNNKLAEGKKNFEEQLNRLISSSPEVMSDEKNAVKMRADFLLDCVKGGGGAEVGQEYIRLQMN